MKVLVIGGVAAGTKAAAKIKRQNRSAEVKILTQSADISYAGCGLSYYVGGMIESREELIVNTPENIRTDRRGGRDPLRSDKCQFPGENRHSAVSGTDVAGEL